MKLLLVFAHPPGPSFNAALKDSFMEGLSDHHEVQVLDLYKEGFNPVLSDKEMHGEISEVTRRHQKALQWADAVVFFYPIWWFRTPAILEGWFDHVLTSGFAYRYKKITKTFGLPVGLLKKRLFVFETYGAPWWVVKFFDFDIPWRRLKRGVFHFCGFRIERRCSFFSVPFASEKKRQQWLKRAHQIAASLKE